jgi:hypothetical protein
MNTHPCNNRRKATQILAVAAYASACAYAVAACFFITNAICAAPDGIARSGHLPWETDDGCPDYWKYDITSTIWHERCVTLKDSPTGYESVLRNGKTGCITNTVDHLVPTKREIWVRNPNNGLCYLYNTVPGGSVTLACDADSLEDTSSDCTGYYP